MRHGKPRSATLAAFISGFVSVVTHAMTHTGKGYKRDSMRNTGRGDDRRKDKLAESDVPKMFRQYRTRYESVPMRSTPHGRAKK